MSNTPMATPEIRRENSKAVASLNVWRARYRETTRAIRACKNELNAAHTYNWPHNILRNATTLSALRAQAAALMAAREVIGIRLRATAYRYAERVPMAAE